MSKGMEHINISDILFTEVTRDGKFTVPADSSSILGLTLGEVTMGQLLISWKASAYAGTTTAEAETQTIIREFVPENEEE